MDGYQVIPGVTIRPQFIFDSIFFLKIEKTDGTFYSLDNTQCHKIRSKILANILCCSEREILIEIEQNGKPVIRHPKTGLSFSTSYARSGWVLAISLAGSVGIDIEDTRNDFDYLKIARRFFSSHEWQFICSIPDEEKICVFYQFWTLKEAYLKATGTGLSGLSSMPDMSSHISAFQTSNKTPFNLGGGFIADIKVTDSFCQAIVFQMSEHKRQ